MRSRSNHKRARYQDDPRTSVRGVRVRHLRDSEVAEFQARIQAVIDRVPPPSMIRLDGSVTIVKEGIGTDSVQRVRADLGALITRLGKLG